MLASSLLACMVRGRMFQVCEMGRVPSSELQQALLHTHTYAQGGRLQETGARSGAQPISLKGT